MAGSRSGEPAPRSALGMVSWWMCFCRLGGMVLLRSDSSNVCSDHMARSRWSQFDGTLFYPFRFMAGDAETVQCLPEILYLDRSVLLETVQHFGGQLPECPQPLGCRCPVQDDPRRPGIGEGGLQELQVVADELQMVPGLVLPGLPLFGVQSEKVEVLGDPVHVVLE